MKGVFALLSLAILLSCGGGEKSKEHTVYVCTGSSATRYHISKSCKGLDSCNGDIASMSEDDAVSSGRTPCGLCVKYDSKTSLGEYIYIDTRNIIHVSRRCPKLNYKMLKSERVKVSDFYNDGYSYCPYCVSDDDYEAIESFHRHTQ